MGPRSPYREAALLDPDVRRGGAAACHASRDFPVIQAPLRQRSIIYAGPVVAVITVDDVLIQTLEKVTLRNPILVEGLPGVGNVGKLAADYLREQLKAKPLATIYSKFFPPQVYVGEEGIIRLVSNDLHYFR
ncbi:protein containing DUF75, partial [mine drainage metagenome]